MFTYIFDKIYEIVDYIVTLFLIKLLGGRAPKRAMRPLTQHSINLPALPDT